jgi:iron complex transport system substrate-binding protein
MIGNKKYGRIVSLAPSITETLFAIGLGGKIAGRTESCDWPEQTASIPVVGGFKTVDAGTILGLSPDMVMGTTLHGRILGEIRNSGTDTAEIEAFAVYDAPSAIRKIASAANVPEKGEDVAQRIEDLIRSLKMKASALPSKRVCYLCNIACPAWYGCQVASAVEFLNCSVSGRGLPGPHEGEGVIERIVSDAPDMFLVPGCGKCRKECIEPVLNGNFLLNDYISKSNAAVVSIGSNLLGRSGPRAPQALDELGGIIFGHLWKD